jgi:hypothetical protein
MKVGITCRQPFLGADDWIAEEIKKSKTPAAAATAEVKKPKSPGAGASEKSKPAEKK